MSFAVNGLPPTTNHDKGQAFGRKFLTKDTKLFRDKVAFTIGHQKFTFKTGGTVCALVFLESPNWVSGKLTLNRMDGDNRIKPLFDAIQNHILKPDEINWEHHVYKVASKNKRTTVYMIDLGDLVDFYT